MLQLSEQLSPEKQTIEKLSDIFACHARLHIEDFVSGISAQQLYQAVTDYPHWNLCTRLQQQHLDMDAMVVDAWPKEKMQELLKFVHDLAQTEFQYLYKTIPVYDLYHKDIKPRGLVKEVYESLNSTAFLDFFRTITRQPAIQFVDCQVTCFEPGHFLTRHDDAVAGKNRVAAYVLNLTPDWQSDWGGALHFYDEQGHSDQAWTPKFNALNVFAVGQPHAVSYVTPFAGRKRYAITGWLRTGHDPMLAV